MKPVNLFFSVAEEKDGYRVMATGDRELTEEQFTNAVLAVVMSMIQESAFFKKAFLGLMIRVGKEEFEAELNKQRLEKVAEIVALVNAIGDDSPRN